MMVVSIVRKKEFGDMASNKTVNQITSQIINSLRSVNTDAHFSKRFIWDKLISTTGVFVKRENDARRLYKSSDIWTPINCFPLERKSPVECCIAEVPECYWIMKSKYKLPATFTNNSGNIIREVSSILPVNSPYIGRQPVLSPTFFFPVSGAKEYRNKINHEYVNPNIKYYWIEDDYIFIPDAEIEAVRVVAYFVRPWEVKKFDFCEEEEQCVFPLEEPFNLPTYLYGVVEDETLKSLMNYYERIVPDNSPDGSEGIKGPQNLTK